VCSIGNKLTTIIEVEGIKEDIGITIQKATQCRVNGHTAVIGKK